MNEKGKERRRGGGEEPTIKSRLRPIHLLHPLIRPQPLPQTPHPIDARVMQEKHRVLRARPGIHQHAADREMASGVQADGALDVRIEALQIVALVEETHDVRGLGVLRPLGMQIARQAARVGAQSPVRACRGKGHGPESDGVVREWAAGDAAAAGAGVDGDG